MNSSQGIESSASGLGGDRGKHLDKRPKRHLSPNESEVLLASLKELAVGGWKSDNGFRGGYLKKLEEVMKKKFPGTDLKGMPHLHSKIQTWKRNYNSLTTILSRSGIGFKDNMIDCTEEVWEEIIKADPNAKAMRRKTWTMFEDWKEIFGKDRATGDHAEDILDAVNDLLHQENLDQDDASPEYHVNVDELDDTGTWEQTCASGKSATKNSPCAAESVERSGKSAGKKRKSRVESDSIAEVLREISRNTDARLDTLASRIGHEYDMDEARMEAFKLLEKIPDLSLEDRFEVCEKFGKHTERLLIFKGLPESVKPDYVKRILKSKDN